MITWLAGIRNKKGRREEMMETRTSCFMHKSDQQEQNKCILEVTKKEDVYMYHGKHLKAKRRENKIILKTRNTQNIRKEMERRERKRYKEREASLKSKGKEREYQMREVLWAVKINGLQALTRQIVASSSSLPSSCKKLNKKSVHKEVVEEEHKMNTMMNKSFSWWSFSQLLHESSSFFSLCMRGKHLVFSFLPSSNSLTFFRLQRTVLVSQGV